MNQRTGLVLLAGLGSAFIVFLHDRYSVSISDSSLKFSSSKMFSNDEMAAREIASPRNRRPSEPPPSDPDKKGLAPADYASLSPEQIRAFQEQARKDSLAEMEKSQARTRELDRMTADPRSVRYENDGQVYKTLPTVFAVPESEAQRYSNYALWKKELGFAIFSLGEKPPFPVPGLPVLRLEGSNRIVILTGAFHVKSKEIPADEWKSALGLQFVQTFPDIQLSIFKTDKTSLTNLSLIIDRLRNDPRVESADFQVVEHVYAPR